MYAVFKDKVLVDGRLVTLIDLLNSPGMVVDGVRVQEWTTKNLLPTSGKLIPEFDRRRNIKDMFSKKPSFSSRQPSTDSTPKPGNMNSPQLQPDLASASESQPQSSSTRREEQFPATVAEAPSPTKQGQTENVVSIKRNQVDRLSSSKKLKTASQPSIPRESSKGQQSLKGFFASRSVAQSQAEAVEANESAEPKPVTSETSEDQSFSTNTETSVVTSPAPVSSQKSENDVVIDAVASKESWGKLFVKPTPPKCEHDEPCKTMLAKKSGINCGRSFWMCARPLGPSGNKERGTQWRCPTFIWATDWNGVG